MLLAIHAQAPYEFSDGARSVFFSEAIAEVPVLGIGTQVHEGRPRSSLSAGRSLFGIRRSRINGA